MIDGNQADDKIIAVLRDDAVYGQWQDISDCPKSLIDRLRHYFLTNKGLPDPGRSLVEITDVYSRAEAVEIIKASLADYRSEFGAPDTRIEALISTIKSITS